MTRLRLVAALLASQAPLAGMAAQPAPAFTAPQLLAPPTDAWITNGGTLFNQRYSPLYDVNQIQDVSEYIVQKISKQ